jgi:hypothetical protein
MSKKPASDVPWVFWDTPVNPGPLPDDTEQLNSIYEELLIEEPVRNGPRENSRNQVTWKNFALAHGPRQPVPGRTIGRIRSAAVQSAACK